jgi:AraC family transcriptional regulator, regulatory protein of adaptative response / methylated-DNA-[protein]-cysteine methyltransferase
MSGAELLSFSGDPSRSEIFYALGASSLGTVLVARKPQGVCAILLGDDPDRLERALAEIFPESARAPTDDALAPELAAAIDLAERPWAPFAPSLAIGGTEFQRRVWSAVRAVAPGTTVSYAEIARRIGAPSALRAVAGACAANVLAIAIPCHRILRSNGTLSGYRWGMERKRRLLEREQRR